mgnify:FL=1
MIASIILSITVFALSNALSAGHQLTYDAMREARAQALAEALIDEVISLPYDDPEGETVMGPDTGETSRSLYDNIDDFNGYLEEAGALADADGTSYPTTYQEFSRSVTVTSDPQTVAGFGGGSPLTGIRVIVTVQDATGRTWIVTRFVNDPTP